MNLTIDNSDVNEHILAKFSSLYHIENTSTEKMRVATTKLFGSLNMLMKGRYYGEIKLAL